MNRGKYVYICLLAVVLGLWGLVETEAQAGKFWDEKPYTRWKEREARQFLEESPWCYEFQWGNIGDIGQSVRFGVNSEREYITIFRLALFSAQIVRQAYVATVAKGDQRIFNRYREFVNRNYDEIVVAMTIDSIPQGLSSVFDVYKQLSSLRLPDLVNNTYLATDTGKKVFIKDYIPPTPDGTGAKFIFPRWLPDGTPLITALEKSVRFQTTTFRIKEADMNEEIANSYGGSRTSGSAAFAQETRSLKTDIVTVDGTFRVPRLFVKGALDY
jgi:hypothetical protein